ncbi:MAG TPA: hypothetical protein VMG59_02445 [Phycisphaerae bacterium]|nr:hypothetical protein [Phycisphaerae bacterium]
MRLLQILPTFFLTITISATFPTAVSFAQPAGNFTASNKPITQNGIEVQIVSVLVENVRLERFGGYFSQSPDQQLVIKVQIINQTGRQLSYQTWRGDITGLTGATVQDDQGAQYPQTPPPEGFTVFGAAADTANINAGQALSDILTFQKPNPGARNLYITLPGSNVGAPQDFDFVAPAPAAK